MPLLVLFYLRLIVEIGSSVAVIFPQLMRKFPQDERLNKMMNRQIYDCHFEVWHEETIAQSITITPAPLIASSFKAIKALFAWSNEKVCV